MAHSSYSCAVAEKAKPHNWRHSTITVQRAVVMMGGQSPHHAESVSTMAEHFMLGDDSILRYHF